MSIISYKPFTTINIVIVILILLSTFAYPVPLIKNDKFEQDKFEDIYKFKREHVNYFCQNEISHSCCPYLAHRVASHHFSRWASIILINKSGYDMTLGVTILTDGRWITSFDYYDHNININCMPHSLKNGESEAISSVTSHFLGGVRGFATFIIDDDISSKFIISWTVPTIGFRKYSFDFFSESARDKYSVKFDPKDKIPQIKIYQNSWSLCYIFVPIVFIVPCCLISPKKGEISFDKDDHNDRGQQSQQSYQKQFQGQQPNQQSHQEHESSYQSYQGEQPYSGQGRQSYNSFK